jgi:3-deoxy-D-manno-octulosonic-acid transferase
MRSLYNILFAIGFTLAAPFYFLRMFRRGQWRQGLAERFGRYGTRIKVAITNRHVLWLHAVSVGEVNLCLQLIRALEPRVPNLKMVVSTTTSTAMAELRKRLPNHIDKIYYPVDLRRSVSRALKTLRPEAVVLIEAEIWPNFLWSLQSRRTPVFLVNARLSERSFHRYRRFGFLFRPLFASLAGVGAQTEADAARLIELGCRPETVHVVGGLKFDTARVEERRLLDAAALLRQVGVPAGAPILLGGSTHAGEEAILADVFQRLRARFPDLFLVLVPRHFERGKQVGEVLRQRGIRFTYRREVRSSTQLAPRSLDALVVNTTGELKYFYEEATVVFVGKSLAAEGGQNPAEPAALGKPVVFGPHMQNFAAMAASFVREDGGVQVADAAGLEAALAALLADPARRETIGANAIRVVKAHTGALERTVDMIVAAIPPDENYVAPTG